MLQRILVAVLDVRDIFQHNPVKKHLVNYKNDLAQRVQHENIQDQKSIWTTSVGFCEVPRIS